MATACILVQIDVDFWEVWNDLPPQEQDSIYQELRADFGGNPVLPDYNLSDPVKRLAAITELRGLGYTVEAS